MKESNQLGDVFQDGDRDPSHDALVSFLKQHKPIAPPPKANFEQELLAAIDQEIRQAALGQTKRTVLRKWLPWVATIPAVIAAIVGVSLVNSRSNWEYASKPLNDRDRETIESSLISSWSMNEDVVSLASDLTNDSTRDAKILMYVPPVEYE
ncbi:MAG: hypothetical protein NW214_07110 [Pseudanabaenaceae cyanobacterium bins.39]|nr:hypothetical protein [Pseudanabaenaceae cyanobacterium bins.39]